MNEIKINNISHSFGDNKVLSNINLNLRSGVYGFIGANGAGKTTLIRILCGLLKPSEGQILYNDETINTQKYRALVGLMPQSQRGYDNFTGYQLLWYMASMKNLDKEKAETNIKQLIEMASMESFIHTKIKTYSGGMRQRLMLSQALLGDPKVVYLDEPTAGLDPSERIKIRNYISQFAKSRIVIIATHVMQDVESIANEIILIKDGAIEYFGSVPDILASLDKIVYKQEIDFFEIETYQKKYKVSNIIQKEDKAIINYINDQQAEDDAVLIQPTLEEVYLYYLV